MASPIAAQVKKRARTAIIYNGWRFFTFTQMKYELGIDKSDNSMVHYLSRALDTLEREGHIQRVEEKKSLKHFRYQVVKI
jgi:hypothetical protein